MAHEKKEHNKTWKAKLSSQLYSLISFEDYLCHSRNNEMTLK